MNPAIEIPEDLVANLCLRYKVRQLALFGSALCDDSGPESDVDFLVEFDPTAQIGFLTLARSQLSVGYLGRQPQRLESVVGQ